MSNNTVCDKINFKLYQTFITLSGGLIYIIQILLSNLVWKN